MRPIKHASTGIGPRLNPRGKSDVPWNDDQRVKNALTLAERMRCNAELLRLSVQQDRKLRRSDLLALADDLLALANEAERSTVRRAETDWQARRVA